VRKAGARISASAAFAVLFLLAACTRRAAFDPDSAYRRGLLLRQRGDLAAALAIANDGLARFNHQPDSRWYWSFRLLKAEVLLGESDIPHAGELLPNPSVTLAQAPDLQVRLLRDWGWLKASLSDYEESLRFLGQALDLARSRDLPQLGADIEFRRVGDLGRLGRIEEAGPDAEEGLRLAKRTGDINLQSSALGTLGFVRMNTGRFDEALPWFQQALDLAGQAQSKSVTALTLNNMGLCYVKLGEPDKALPNFQRAEALASKIGDATDQQISLGRIGDEYQSAGDYQQALSYYKQALAITRRSHDAHWTANWLHNLTETSIQMGDLKSAGEYNSEALAIHANLDDPTERLWPQIDRARIAEAGRQPDEAESVYRSVIQAAEGLHSEHEPSLILSAHAGLASLLVTAHRDREAEAEFERALVLINTQRASIEQDEFRISYLSSLVSFYRDYVDLLASQHRDVEALQVAESSRARVLSEKLDVSDPSGGPAGKRDYRDLARTSRTILLSYWLAPRRSYLWVVTPAKVAQFELPPQAQIEALANDYNQAIRQLRDPLREGSDTGRKLYEILLKPAQALIPPGSSVAVAPDGGLHNLNFETLLVGGAPHYWIEDARVSVIPSLDLVSRRRSAPQNGRTALLLIGDPLPSDNRNFPRLAEAGGEIEGIRQEYADATVRTGADATPGAYAASKPERFSIIHFTAHAEANSDDALDSAIILSPQGDRYKLYAREVVGIPIRADLVTISACSGAAGRTFAGEGLVGFAWSFLRAGARNVIAGLWEVDDRSTAWLMDTLYAGLRHGMSPEESLRQAQLTLLKSQEPYPKPYYWAPFQVISDDLTR